MAKPVIHLLSVAGSDRDLAPQLGLDSAKQIVELAQNVVGSKYRVTGNARLMGATVDERRGGRDDDAQRARDVERNLADDRVTAIISVRGGAWLTRVLPRIDFDVLKKRKTVVSVFGFSELSSLVNICAGYRRARAYYDLGPGFLLWALRNHATENIEELSTGLNSDIAASHDSRKVFSLGWAKARFRPEFESFFSDVVDIIEGRASRRTLTGELVSGALRANHKIKVTGGCLSVIVGLLGSRFQKCLNTQGKWLAIEDIREDMYRIDRYLAMLKLAGAFEKCDGILLGDFHLDDEDQTEAILQLLKHHLPPRRKIPIIAHCNFGHCYPVASLPLNQTLRIERGRGKRDTRVEFIPHG